MWECTVFFLISTNSENGLDTYMVGSGIKHTIGTYNLNKDIYIPDKGSVDGDSGLRYDYGKFYASKTFFDSVKQRRILWGWINEALPQPKYIKQGWSGAIPRNIWLDKSRKQLMQWPISEIETLRMNQVDLPSKLVKGRSMLEISSITVAQADVEISFSVLGIEKAKMMDPSWTNPQLLCSQKDASIKGGLGLFGLKVLALKDLKEHTSVFFRIFKAQSNKHVVLMCSDQSMFLSALFVNNFSLLNSYVLCFNILSQLLT
ncbi:hypothetical protein HYC85_025665 [Camellia sinensis]|uniref:Glycosyl hydrolase family 32 N-terminal domain-containing protein n=1 Tax=Camellia sinensis TaxID=4442 RepID=A0A7J7GBM7_CAMSI|nr:hypothetical protein HYC85_025665 [Camellia sinensis]